MNITFTVNQDESLKRGINAPSSTVVLDVDPAELTQVERDVLATVLVNGHDATKYGLAYDPDTLRAGYDIRLSLVEPSIHGMRETIAAALASREAKREATLAQLAEQSTRVLALRPETVTHYARLWDDGKINVSTSAGADAVEIQLPTFDAYVPSEISTEAREYYDRVKAETEAQARAVLESVLPELRARKEARDRAAQATAEKIANEHAALIARLPAELRERYAAGFASVDVELVDLVLSDLGLTDDEPDGWRGGLAVTKNLTAGQFAVLKALRAKLSRADLENLDIEVGRVWDYRAAEEDEESDKDGEVKCNKRVIAHVTFTCMSVSVNIGVRLGD